MSITENFENSINLLIKIDSNNSSVKLGPEQSLVSAKKRNCIQNFFGWFIYIITFTLVPRNRELDTVTKRILGEAKCLDNIKQLKVEEKERVLKGIAHLINIIKRNSGSGLSKVETILATIEKIEIIAARSLSPNRENLEENSLLETPTKFETPKEVSHKNPPLSAPAMAQHSKTSTKQEAMDLFFKTFQKDDFESHKTWIQSQANKKFFETFEREHYEALVSDITVLKNLFSALDRLSEDKSAQEIFIQCTNLLFNQFRDPLTQNKALEKEVYYYLSEDQQKQLPLKEYNAAMALFLDDRLGICKDSVLMMQKYFELTDEETNECKKTGIFSEGSPQKRDQKEVEDYFKDLFVLIKDYNPDVIRKIIKELLDIQNCPLIEEHFALLIKKCTMVIVQQRFIAFLKESTNLDHISALIKRLLATQDAKIMRFTLEALKIQPWKLWVFLAKNPTFDRQQIFSMDSELENLIKMFDQGNPKLAFENLSQFFNLSQVDQLKNFNGSVIVGSIIQSIKKLNPSQLINHIPFMNSGEIFAILTDPELRTKISKANIQNKVSRITIDKFKSIIDGFMRDLGEESKEYEFFNDLNESFVVRVLFSPANKTKAEPILVDATKMKVFNGARRAIGALATSSPRRFKAPASI